VGQTQKLVKGPGQNIFTLVGLGQPSLVWVCVWKIYPKNQFFSFWIKKSLLGSVQKVSKSKTGRPLIYCRSKVCSARVRAISTKSLTSKHFQLQNNRHPDKHFVIDIYENLWIKNKVYFWDTISSYKPWVSHSKFETTATLNNHLNTA